jgi:hypothetical protein
MRIFTGWNNPFGGGTHKDVCKTLVSGALGGPDEEDSPGPLIQYVRNGL